MENIGPMLYLVNYTYTGAMYRTSVLFGYWPKCVYNAKYQQVSKTGIDSLQQSNLFHLFFDWTVSHSNQNFAKSQQLNVDNILAQLLVLTFGLFQ